MPRPKIGRGGKRPGSGRPRKEPTKQIRVPISLADWIKANLDKIKELADPSK